MSSRIAAVVPRNMRVSCSTATRPAATTTNNHARDQPLSRSAGHSSGTQRTNRTT
jgi:hypothetical protein